MRTTHRLTVVALLATTALTYLAAAALAKGPETGTLEGPGIETPILFLDQSQSFNSYDAGTPLDLLRLSGLWYAPGVANTSPPKVVGEPHTLTWVNMGPPGDPVEDRTITQYLYLDTEDGAFIHTPKQPGLDGWGQSVVGWFKAPDGLKEAVAAIVTWAETPEAQALQPESTRSARSTSPLWLVFATIGIVGVLVVQSRFT